MKIEIIFEYVFFIVGIVAVLAGLMKQNPMFVSQGSFLCGAALFFEVMILTEQIKSLQNSEDEK